MNDFAVAIGKIESLIEFANPKFWRKTGIGNVFFWSKLENERKATSSRNLDRQKDEALVGGRQVSPDRSHLSHMACSEKLSAPLRPVPVNNAEARAEPVLGLLANRLKCTSTLPAQIIRRF
jgi:hypothetical protein